MQVGLKWTSSDNIEAQTEAQNADREKDSSSESTLINANQGAQNVRGPAEDAGPGRTRTKRRHQEEQVIIVLAGRGAAADGNTTSSIQTQEGDEPPTPSVFILPTSLLPQPFKAQNQEPPSGQRFTSSNRPRTSFTEAPPSF